MYDSADVQKVVAITEDDNEIAMRDANSSRERPKLEGYDFEDDDLQQIEVSFQL